MNNNNELYLQLEKLITKNYFLNQSAKEAFKSYVRAYDSHQLKTIFNVDTLDMAKVALSFGFTVPPVVDLRKYQLRSEFTTRKSNNNNNKAIVTFIRDLFKLMKPVPFSRNDTQDS